MTRLAAFVALPVVAAVAFFAVRYFDLGGSYAGALAGFATLSVTSTLLVMLARRPSAKDAAATTAADGPEPSRPAATAPPPVPEPEPAAAAVSTAGGGEPDAPAAPPEREPSVVGPAARPEREAAAVGPAAAKPRSYMGEDDEPTSEGDYMHRRLAQPSDCADPPPDGSAQSPAGGSGPVSTAGERGAARPEQESPQLREPISGEFIPADERDQIDQHAAPEPPRPPQRPRAAQMAVAAHAGPGAAAAAGVGTRPPRDNPGSGRHRAHREPRSGEPRLAAPGAGRARLLPPRGCGAVDLGRGRDLGCRHRRPLEADAQRPVGAVARVLPRRVTSGSRYSS